MGGFEHQKGLAKLDIVGTYSGIVTITCEDAYRNAFSQTLEVSLTVDEPLTEVDNQQEEEENKHNNLEEERL